MVDFQLLLKRVEDSSDPSPTSGSEVSHIYTVGVTNLGAFKQSSVLELIRNYLTEKYFYLQLRLKAVNNVLRCYHRRRVVALFLASILILRFIDQTVL